MHVIAEREGMTSLMNNTKWREVLLSLREVNLSYRLKILKCSEPSAWGNLSYGHIPLNYVEPHGWGGLIRLAEIEWLEINTLDTQWRGKLVDDDKIDLFQEVQTTLSSLNVACIREERIIRIYGYIRTID